MTEQSFGDSGIRNDRDLAEAIGIEPVSLSRLETGDRALSLSALQSIADALGLQLSQMVGIEHSLPETTMGPREAASSRPSPSHAVSWFSVSCVSWNRTDPAAERAFDARRSAAQQWSTRHPCEASPLLNSKPLSPNR